MFLDELQRDSFYSLIVSRPEDGRRAERYLLR